MVINFKTCLSLFVIFLVGCGGGGGSTSIDTSASRFAISANVSGLNAGNQIQLSNGSDSVTATGNGPVQVSNQLANGTQYSITISAQPTGQTCTVSYATGTIASASVTNILVNCSNNPAPTYSISYSISGLANGETISVTDGTQIITSSSNSNNTFTNQLTSNSNYIISISTQPQNQFCIVTNSSGIIVSSNITNISINCYSVYNFSGSNVIYTPNVTGIVTGNSSRTYNLWAKIDPTNFSDAIMISQGTLSAYRGSSLGISSVASQPVSFTNGTGNFYIFFDVWVGSVWSSKFNLNDSQWHMYSLVFDSSSAGLGTSLYFDGMLLPTPIANPQNGFTKGNVNTLNYNDSINIGGHTFNGTSPYLNSGFTGGIRNVAAWNVALTSAEISNIYSTGVRPSTGLIFTKD